MWVEEVGDNSLYFQRSANISIGGLFLEKTIPHPPGTRVKLQFTLPGDKEPLEVVGEIVHGEEFGDRLGMGVKFVSLPKAVHQHLEKFIRLRDGK